MKFQFRLLMPKSLTDKKTNIEANASDAIIVKIEVMSESVKQFVLLSFPIENKFNLKMRLNLAKLILD